jgi:hypothetical protein
MTDVRVDELITHIAFEADAQPGMREQVVNLALASCPAGGSLELEQSLQGVGTVRVKITKPG